MTFEEIQIKALSLTEAESAAIQRQIIKEYAAAFKAIDKEIQAVYNTILDGVKPEDYLNAITKYNRLIKLNEEIQKLYIEAMKKVKDLQITNSTLSISNNYYRQLYALNWASTQTVFVGLNPSVIEASVFSASKIWDTLAADTRRRIESSFGSFKNYYPQSGTLLNELIKKNSGVTLANLETILRQSLIQGKSYRKTVGAIKDLLNTDTNKALRIAITEGHRNMMAGDYAVAQAVQSEGIAARRKIVATRDMRTRPQSAQVDGQIEDENGYFTYPGGVKVAIPGNSGVARWDIRDREATTMIVDGFDSELVRARNPVTGETDLITMSPFNDWMKDNNLYYDKSGVMRHKK